MPGALLPLADARRVHVARTYAHVAAGAQGLVIANVTNPERPRLSTAVTLDGSLSDASKGLDRDRAVDETGGQIAVFGRFGSRPFTAEEMQRLYRNRRGLVWKVSDRADIADWRGPRPPLRTAGVSPQTTP